MCKRGLALRVDNELIGSQSNGNCLGLLVLVTEYDDFWKKHITKKETIEVTILNIYLKIIENS